MILGFVLAFFLQGQTLFSDFVKVLEQTPERNRQSLVVNYLKGRLTPLVENDSMLTFVWFGRADSVRINGSLQGGWRSPEKMRRIPCGDAARSPVLYYRTYTVAPDARIEYKFIVNGEYRIDSTNQRTAPPGDFVNSEAVMPRFRMSSVSVYRAGIAHGTMDSLEFVSKDSTILPRRVWIYLPPGYAQLRDLPVVYVHDGGSAMRFAFIPTIVDNLIAERQLPPIICVFVPPVERNPEYVGLKIPAFIAAFCDELVPHIDSTYRTSSSPLNRGVMGISNGGHIALSMAVVRPDRFLCAAGQSSTISPFLRTVLAMRQQITPLPRTMRIWMDWGSYDIIDEEYNFPVLNRAFSAELTRYGIPHRFREVHDGHDWASWRERTPDILRFFFAPLQVNEYNILQQR